MKLYIPNLQTLVDFFDRFSSGSASLNQSAGGRLLQVLHVSIDHSKSSDNKHYPSRTVLPAEQTTAQAKSDL